jgi:hypothetical protein
MRGRRFLSATVCLFAAGCGNPTADPLPPAILPAGTALRAVLLKSLESGVDPSGTQVPALLIDSLVDKNGYILIPAGLTTVGTVTWSRRGTAFTAVANQPPRMDVRFDTLELPDGTKLPITIDEEGAPGQSFSFTRTNVPRMRDVPSVEGRLNERERSVLAKLQDTFTDSKTKPSLSEDDFRILESLAEKFDLAELSALKKKSGLTIRDLVSLLAAGSNVTGGAGAVAAAGQLVTLLGEAGRVLGGVLKGPNVRVPVGTPVILRLSAEVQVKRDESKREAPNPDSRI